MTKILFALFVLASLMLAGGCKSSQPEGPTAQEPLPALGAGNDPRNPPAANQ
jgi:hypothetical protein